MRVETKDLVKKLVGNGQASEDFVHDLVRDVCRSCQIDPINVDWDHRPSVKDGGRDVVVRIANQTCQNGFIPSRPSLWSIKSGKEGVQVTALRKEVLGPNHKKVREDLEQGHTFVWCSINPASNPQRTKLREAADKIADKLGIDRSQFEFRWPEHLQGEANRFPGVIAVHLPDIAARFVNIMTLGEWTREFDRSDLWIDFSSRDKVIKRISEHLLSTVPPNVLHIAGLSGIGKSRTVFEACKRKDELHGVFYVDRFERIDQPAHEFYRYLHESGQHIFLVIDETSFDERARIKGLLGTYSDRIRVVTIGPAIRQPPVEQEELLVLSEPDIDAGVYDIVRAAGPELTEEVCRSISYWAGHDLRLALMLVRASTAPELRGVPLVNIDDFWNRVMRLFANSIGDKNRFRDRYEILTASVDVGMEGSDAHEISMLADFFQLPEQHVRAAATNARECGLGIRTKHFFEAAPRALAARLFETRIWNRVKDCLPQFMSALTSCSPRLAKRFLERCHDCSGSIREEVTTHVGEFFLAALSAVDISALRARDASRLFQEWAEFDPVRGLGWLRREVEEATPEQLASLDGEPDGSGGWRGRRQLVWLCQNLASFPEHFEDCETTLFRFALHETEPSIGNNSTQVWQSLFWPGLGSTALPPTQRLPILLRRLRSATVEELPLVLSGAIGFIERRTVGLPLPSSIVGGRVAPVPWRPITWAELRDLRRTAAAATLDVISHMEGERRIIASRVLAKQFRPLVEAGVLQELRSILSEIDDQTRPKLVADLEQYIHLIQNVGVTPDSENLIPQLSTWLAEVSHSDLSSRVRALTIQDYWSTWERDTRDTRYERLADELIGSPGIFRGLGTSLCSVEAKSGAQLVFIIGRRDDRENLSEIVREWLKAGSNQSVVANYLGGIVARLGGLPSEWSTALDEISASEPAFAATVTSSADVSINGFDRLIKLVDRLPRPAARFLRPLAIGHWLAVLQQDQRKFALETLSRLAEFGDEQASAIGMDLIRMWEHVDKGPISETLAPIALDLASRLNPDSGHHEVHNWYEVLLSLAPSYPRHVSQLMIDFVTIPTNFVRLFEDQFAAVISRAASVDSTSVMEVVGAAILDPKRRSIFGISVITGLFETIGVQSVSQWVEKHGTESLPWLARHFKSPYLNEDAKPVVPPLTEWLFREHQSHQMAFDWFCMGRSAKAFYAADIDPDRKRQELQPFLTHDLRRVREWAQYEVAVEEREAQFFREYAEEDERR